MRTSRKLALSLAFTACAAIASLAPAAASADAYGPALNTWSSSDSSSGLCIPGLICPLITDAYHASGGPGGAGDDYISTSVIGIAAVGSTSTSTWQSAPFQYNGAGGNTPGSASLTLIRRSDVSALLNVIGNQAQYQVKLVDLNTGIALNVIGPTTQAGADDWTAVPAVGIAPSQLSVGHTYVIQVISSFTNGTGASVLPAGEADYDNVVLTTTAASSGGGGGNGQYGYGNPYGDGITNSASLSAAIAAQGIAGSAHLKKGKLRIKVKCPASSPCNFVLQGLRGGKGSKPATSRAKATVGPGKKKTVTMKVKKKFRSKYDKAKKITIRANVAVRDIAATVFKKVKLIHG